MVCDGTDDCGNNLDEQDCQTGEKGEGAGLKIFTYTMPSSSPNPMFEHLLTSVQTWDLVKK